MDKNLFSDRRDRGKDRREQNRLADKPSTGCRRTSCRRDRIASTDPKPWWLKVSYSQEVSAAVVRSNQRPKLYRNEIDPSLQKNTQK
jgi:hypothetical protein